MSFSALPAGSKAYEACCRSRALDPDAVVCPDCGRLLLRCPGFSECHGLVLPWEACGLHVAPRLELDRGALLQARIGEAVALPLIFRNESHTGTTLRVDRILKRETGTELEDVRLLWDRLGPGEERKLHLETGILDAGGSRRVDVIAVVSARLGETVETWAWAAEILLRVKPGEKREIHQHIHVEGSRFEAGAAAVVQTGPSTGERSTFGQESGVLSSRVPIAEFHRAELFELEQGLRGYAAAKLRVPRSVELRTTGFPLADAFPPSRLFASRPALRCGRNSRKAAAQNPTPNDLTLRVYERADGSLDRERSLRISGHLFDLYVRCDRLCIRAAGRDPLDVSGEEVPPGGERAIVSGDRIRLLRGSTGAFDVVFGFEAEEGEVQRISLARETA